MNALKDPQEMISRVDSLPPIPQISQKILSLKINTDEGVSQLYSLIEKDPALMTRLIGLANSPLYATGRKILTLHEAEAVLGSKQVKMISLSFAMMASISRKSKGLIDLDGLWKHSLSIAMAMETLAKFIPIDQRPQEEEIYLAGLLHDIGFLVLNYLDPQLCDELCIKVVAEPGRPVVEIEAELFGGNHGELGAELGRRWNLPNSTIAVLQHHHSPQTHQYGKQQPLVELCYLADKLLPPFGIDASGGNNVVDDDWLSLGIDPQLADDIKTKVYTHTDQVANIEI